MRGSCLPDLQLPAAGADRTDRLPGPALALLRPKDYRELAAEMTQAQRATDVAANVEAVRRRIEVACQRAGRDTGSVTLVAVTKTQPPEVVAEAARAGLGLFGENKVQEAKAKIPLCPGNLRWHMIGHLQTNKCRDAV